MIGNVTGHEIGKNKDGEKNVLILQVQLSDADDVQTVQMFSQAGEDTNPATGSQVIVIPINKSWKIGIASSDGIEPSTEPGEKEIYSTDSTAATKLAKHKLDKNGNHIFNDGILEAARKTDSVSLTLSGIDIQSLAASLLTTGAFTPTGNPPAPAASPLTFADGEITSGTSEVKLP